MCERRYDRAQWAAAGISGPQFSRDHSPHHEEHVPVRGVQRVHVRAFSFLSKKNFADRDQSVRRTRAIPSGPEGNPFWSRSSGRRRALRVSCFRNPPPKFGEDVKNQSGVPPVPDGEPSPDQTVDMRLPGSRMSAWLHGASISSAASDGVDAGLSMGPCYIPLSAASPFVGAIPARREN